MNIFERLMEDELVGGLTALVGMTTIATMIMGGAIYIVELIKRFVL